MPITHLFRQAVAGLLVLSLAACGGGGGGGGGDTTAADTVTTEDHDVHVPDGVTIDDSPEGDFDGAMLLAGSDAVSGAVSGATIAGALSSRDLAGFAAQVPAPSGATDASTSLTSFEGTLSSTNSISLTSVGKQTFAEANAVLATYTTTLPSAKTPTGLANDMVQAIGASEAGGTVTNLVQPAGDEPSETDYRVYMGVVYGGSSDVMLLAVVVPESVVSSYSTLAGQTTSTNNVTSTDDSLSSNTDTFTGTSGSGKADFLFVIDESGSMGDEQENLSLAANEFESVITNSGLDYALATITTSDPAYYDILRDTDGDGGIIDDEDLAEFKADVQPGTSGSNTETGIYNAELALQSTAEGDSSDGVVTAASGPDGTQGLPRSDATLSVLIFSDEPSQYTSRSTGGVAFDPANNLFVDRGYIVHAIVEPETEYYDANGQYDDLANNTGGLTADIGEGATFPTVMQQIAQQAGGASSQFQLSQTPITSSIQVTVDGNTVANDSSNGWTYVQGTNTIVFHGSAIPAGGESIEVTYDYATSTTGSVVTAVDAHVAD